MIYRHPSSDVYGKKHLKETIYAKQHFIMYDELLQETCN